ncbi:hypothetical protein RJ639_026039 [Escallonia herrerae]|uniref:G domain-containing protein n=1 Tax=Escallonia herrerae TaxID=1293975 RepID=A0AA88RWZ3_9ASTE|nr:hypothetical protein RJ639_026039 [Escallonia herrerae]
MFLTHIPRFFIPIPQSSFCTQFLTPKPRFLITSALNLSPISHFSSTTPLYPSVPEIETQIEIPIDRLFVPPETDVSSLATPLSTRILKGSNIVLSKYARDAQVAQAEFVKSSVRTEDCPADGLPEFALVGRSNVGKSSLLNSLGFNMSSRTKRALSARSEEVTLNQTVGELQNIQSAYRLNGKNYMKWSQLVRTFLKGNGKLSHLLGTRPKKGDPRFDAWDEEDSMVMSWLWNSMLPEISDTFMFLPTSKEIWEAAQQTYSKVKDAA